MLRAECYFRGHYMRPKASARLVQLLSAEADLVPQYWDIHEPIKRPFQGKKETLVNALITQPGVFFLRKDRPGYFAYVSLLLSPAQWTTPHNRISIDFQSSWIGYETKAISLVERICSECASDFAFVTDESQEDQDRFKELKRSYSGVEFQELIQKKQITPPFGPFGCLPDVYWFNYFGRVYIDFIGKNRLAAAGWASIRDDGVGLSCYTTSKIDDSGSRWRRNQIVDSLQEYYWTPGCTKAEKHLPSFDFSEQYYALSPDQRAKMKWYGVWPDPRLI